jgi:SAM-dependent methyltransferase
MKISRKYPVKHHSKFIAVYRFHDSNMSGNIALMLNYTLKVLKRQKDFLLNKEEKKIYKKGIRIWEDYYSQQLVNAFQPKPACPPKKEMLNEHFISLWHHKKLYYLYLKYRITMSVQKSRKGIKSLIRHNSPLFMQRWMYRNGLTKKFTPLPGHIELGDLNRVTPISTEFGYNRGGPVDRYYIENFLKDESAKINGRVLEIGDNEYTLMFGGKKVTKSDILHITEDNPKATYIGDLSNAPQLPSNSFDCIVLTQTLHLIYNFKGALETCYRVLKQGGSLLLTVPGISHIDHGEWGKNWMWSFTESSIKKALSEVFEVEKTNVQTFGNVLVATAFLYGLGLPELKKEQMDYNDPRYQVIITAVATK